MVDYRRGSDYYSQKGQKMPFRRGKAPIKQKRISRRRRQKTPGEENGAYKRPLMNAQGSFKYLEQKKKRIF